LASTRASSRTYDQVKNRVCMKCAADEGLVYWTGLNLLQGRPYRVRLNVSIRDICLLSGKISSPLEKGLLFEEV
jgi:hypothetical protein